jgi:hypothetical protein
MPGAQFKPFPGHSIHLPSNACHNPESNLTKAGVANLARNPQPEESSRKPGFHVLFCASWAIRAIKNMVITSYCSIAYNEKARIYRVLDIVRVRRVLKPR